MTQEQIQQLMNQQMEAASNGLPFIARHPDLALWVTFFWHLLIAVCAVAAVVLLWRIDKRLSGESGQRVARPAQWEQPQSTEPGAAEPARDNDDRFRPRG